jgi:EmrB/QacA subfamily drug resistance transporter
MTGVPPEEARAAAEPVVGAATRRRTRTLSLDRIALTEDNRRWWTLAAMCFALFMVMLDNTVVNVALPSIQRDLHASISGLEWTVNAYTLTFGMLIVTGGRLGDLFGRRRMFLFGVGVFALSSAAIGLAPTDTALVIGRAIQGIGAAFMMPATLSIITNAFPPHERGKAIGTWAGVSAIALALGPVVGGALVEHVSWRAIFYLNLPVAVGAFVITLYATKESRDETVEPSVDVAGVLLLSSGLGVLVLALVEGNSWGWGSGRIVTLLAGSVMALVAFVAVEMRARAPMLDFSYFRSRSFAGANVVAFIVSFAMLAMFFFMALYMQNIRGYSPLQAGLRFLPSTVVIMFIGPLAGRLSDRIGPRPLMVGGLIAVSGSLLWQSFLDVNTSYSFLAGSFVLMGVGMGFVMSPMSTAAMNAVDQSKAGAASGVLSMSRMVGGTFGVAVLGALVTGLGRGRLGQLLPGVPAGQRERLAENLGSGATSHGLSAGVVRAMKESFVYAMSHGMRLGAGVALLGAAVASALIADRPGQRQPAPAQAERGRVDALPEPART